MAIIVIGAGFAGLAAAYQLQQAGLEVIVLEGRDRIGGRVHTVHDFADFPVELGAELIHGAEVSTWEWVRKLRLDTVPWRKGKDSLVRLHDGRLMTMPEARIASETLDLARSWILEYDEVAPEDEDLESYLRRIGVNDQQLAYIRRMSGNAIGDDLRFLSAQAHVPTLREAGERARSSGQILYTDDHRIVQGYSVIADALAAGLDVRFKQIVTAIHWSDQDVRVYCADGSAYQGEAAVLTLPVGVLKNGEIEFAPRMPAVKRAALDGLRMAPVLKMIFTFAERLTPPEVAAIYSSGNPPMWWTPSYRRNTEDTVWTAFFSGGWARELLAMGERSALRAGLETLRSELDRSGLRYEQAKFVNWVDDPFALGGYSIARPTGANAREMLAEATPPLYWAGEATAPNFMAGTVHGAYESGLRAANEIITQIRASEER